MLYTEFRKTVKDTDLDSKKKKKRRGSRKTTNSREGAVLVDAQRTGWCPFCSVTKSGTVRRKGPDNEARSCMMT